MAVPNTTTFSLQDVVDELGGLPRPDDLIACFAAATSGGFDPSYEGSKNNLLNFRNYTSIVASVVITPATKNSFGNGDSFLVTVTANVAWTVSDNVSWITSSPISGTGNGSFTVTVGSYLSGADRTGTVTVSGSGASDTCIVTQTSDIP
jgi:hypothetical protein